MRTREAQKVIDAAIGYTGARLATKEEHEAYDLARSALHDEAARNIRGRACPDSALYVRLFSDEMQRLAYREGLISYDPSDRRMGTTMPKWCCLTHEHENERLRAQRAA